MSTVRAPTSDPAAPLETRIQFLRQQIGQLASERDGSEHEYTDVKHEYDKLSARLGVLRESLMRTSQERAKLIKELDGLLQEKVRQDNEALQQIHTNPVAATTETEGHQASKTPEPEPEPEIDAVSLEIPSDTKAAAPAEAVAAAAAAALEHAAQAAAAAAAHAEHVARLTQPSPPTEPAAPTPTHEQPAPPRQHKPDDPLESAPSQPHVARPQQPLAAAPQQPAAAPQTHEQPPVAAPQPHEQTVIHTTPPAQRPPVVNQAPRPAASAAPPPARSAPPAAAAAAHQRQSSVGLQTPPRAPAPTLAASPAATAAPPARAAAAPAGSIQDRKKARVPLAVEVDFGSENNLYVGFSEDISEGGVFVATYAPRPVGERLSVQFKLPGQGRVMTVDTEVAWSVPQREDHDGGVGMGLRFVNLTDDDRRALTQFIAQREPLFFPGES